MDVSLWEKYPLLQTMMKLRKASFNAAERLAKRYRWQSLSLVVFSIYVLALSILPKYFHLAERPGQTDIVGFVTIVSSVFVVALSVYSAFSEDVVRGKYLHDNAKQVTHLYNEYKVIVDQHETKSGPSPDTLSFERRYSVIMDSCPYNHDQLDYHSIRPEVEKLSRAHSLSIKSQIFLSCYFWPIIAIIGPPICVAIGFKWFVH